MLWPTPQAPKTKCPLTAIDSAHLLASVAPQAIQQLHDSLVGDTAVARQVQDEVEWQVQIRP